MNRKQKLANFSACIAQVKIKLLHANADDATALGVSK
jgi:hypothetical protein